MLHTLQNMTKSDIVRLTEVVQGVVKRMETMEKAMVDAARLADELRAEQEHSSAQEKAKRSLDSQIVELQGNLEEANDIAIKGGRTAMAKLEARVRELEMELGTAQCRTSDTYKGFQKSERKIKELQFQQDEDHKNQERMTDLAQKLQQVIACSGPSTTKKVFSLPVRCRFNNV